jgi:F420H(2)-dependent quinone reductase
LRWSRHVHSRREISQPPTGNCGVRQPGPNCPPWGHILMGLVGRLMEPASPPGVGAPRLLGEPALRVPRRIRRLTRMHGTVYLWNRRRRLGRWFGLAILVLETVGRRSGKPRRVPIAYLPDGENLVVVPANGGARQPGGLRFSRPATVSPFSAASAGASAPYEATSAERAALRLRLTGRPLPVPDPEAYPGCRPHASGPAHWSWSFGHRGRYWQARVCLLSWWWVGRLARGGEESVSPRRGVLDDLL